MYTYIFINLIFMAMSVTFVYILKPKLNRRALVSTLAILFVCMLVFNTYLTALPIVSYNSERILGFRIGTIPVEDFCYLLVAAILTPSLYARLSTKEQSKS